MGFGGSGGPGMSDSAEIDEWFGAGWAVFQGDRAEEPFPPLSDMEAQRE